MELDGASSTRERIKRRMMKRVGKEDKDENRKVAGPPVDAHLQPPADRVAIQHDAQEPARRKHPREAPERAGS